MGHTRRRSLSTEDPDDEPRRQRSLPFKRPKANLEKVYGCQKGHEHAGLKSLCPISLFYKDMLSYKYY